MQISRLAYVTAAITLAACAEAPTAMHRGGVTLSPAGADAAVENPTNSVGSTVRWNREAVRLFRQRGGDAGRMLAYVSLAQYRATLAADDARHGMTRPSLAGAVAVASSVVLKQFFPLDSAVIDAVLAEQRQQPAVGTERNLDFAAGEAIGLTVGTAVLAQAATDNFGQTNPGTPPVGPGYWTSSGAPLARGLLGVRPFFMTSGSELRSAAPPAYGSPEFEAAIAEVRALAAARTPAQVAVAQRWVPFSSPLFNDAATEFIVKYHRSERDAARILAYANAAAFDAIIGCFDAKYTYWYIRPRQADPTITLAVGQPNHPSYPSGHSCQTGGLVGVLVEEFPQEREALEALATEASESRIHGGLHYRFDAAAGLALGRAAARLALERRGLE
jgi:membrane-associated phospholipid phosphatase